MRGLVIFTVPAPRVSNPTPTPSMLMSMRKVKGAAKFCRMFSVLRKAQFISAALPVRSMESVPMAHRPRPGGRNLKVKMRSYMSCADRCALRSLHGRCCRRHHHFWMV